MGNTGRLRSSACTWLFCPRSFWRKISGLSRCARFIHAQHGVQRQDCGRLGKLENCQVGVFACLGRGDRAALVDFRLFLPEEWAADEARCQRVKVPVIERVHRTKAELAMVLVEAARARGSSPQWIGGEEVDGDNRGLTDALDASAKLFLMDLF